MPQAHNTQILNAVWSESTLTALLFKLKAIMLRLLEMLAMLTTNFLY